MIQYKILQPIRDPILTTNQDGKLAHKITNFNVFRQIYSLNTKLKIHQANAIMEEVF